MPYTNNEEKKNDSSGVVQYENGPYLEVGLIR